ncbi:MAG TPA: response regulator transcription factor [Acidobacteriaceae bacterium]|jgi:two-component system NarL family response regulator
MKPIRLFIVDDHHVVRMGLQSMLRREQDIQVVGTADSGAAAIAALKNNEVDVLLTDLRMPGMGGDALLLELRKLKPNLRSVVLTNYHSDEDVFGAIKAGAMAFVLKTATMEEVLDAIRSVHAGHRWIPPHIADQLAQRLARNPVSARENEVLQLLARGLRNREIGQKLFISENTVRNHVISLLEKLGTTHRTEGIAIALQQGLVRLDE